MKVYNNTSVHLLIGIIIVLIIIIAGLLMKLTNLTIGIILAGVILIGTPLFYKVLQKIPKHDDDIHYHEGKRIR